MNRLESIEYIYENYKGFQGGYQFSIIGSITFGYEYNKEIQYSWGEIKDKNRTYTKEQLDEIINLMEEY